MALSSLFQQVLGLCRKRRCEVPEWVVRNETAVKVGKIGLSRDAVAAAQLADRPAAPGAKEKATVQPQVGHRIREILADRGWDA